VPVDRAQAFPFPFTLWLLIRILSMNETRSLLTQSERAAE
jgi:hypothetical protein